MSSDPSRLIAVLARDRINLDLQTLDLCFLADLYLRADRASLAPCEEEHAAAHNANMGNETIDAATGELIPNAAKERAGFINAVSAGLGDLGVGREFPFNDAAIRIGLDRGEVSSCAAVGDHSAPVGH